MLPIIKRGSKEIPVVKRKTDFSSNLKVKMFPQMPLLLLSLEYKLSCPAQSVQLPLRCGLGAILPLREQHNTNPLPITTHTLQQIFYFK